MNTIHQTVEALLDGQPAPTATDSTFPQLLADMGATADDPKALQALGIAVLRLLAARIESTAMAERELGILQAKKH